MPEIFIADSEVVDDKEDRVIFDIHSPEHDMKRGVISGDALRDLGKNKGGGDLAEIFGDYRDTIGRRAGDHWLANPGNEIIILGRGDFS